MFTASQVDTVQRAELKPLLRHSTQEVTLWVRKVHQSEALGVRGIDGRWLSRTRTDSFRVEVPTGAHPHKSGNIWELAM